MTVILKALSTFYHLIQLSSQRRGADDDPLLIAVPEVQIQAVRCRQREAISLILLPRFDSPYKRKYLFSATSQTRVWGFRIRGYASAKFVMWSKYNL